MDTTLSFMGAARNVTGSCYLLQYGQTRLLVDCGMYQERKLRYRNWDPFPFPARDIDAVLLTHAHLDHCGLIPKLVREGFNGQIIGTSATLDIAKIVLLDSARIQQEDARLKKKRHARERRKGPYEEAPLYTVDDAEASFHFLETCEYEKPVFIDDNITVTFHEAGHILGSAMILISIGDAAVKRTFLFSGDIGRWDMPILRDPTSFVSADYVVMESTYGDRIHEDPADTNSLLSDVIRETQLRRGNIIIPSFAIGRTQDLLYRLNVLLAEDRIPNLPVFVDSPMASRVTDVFRGHPEFFDKDMMDWVDGKKSPFDLKNLHTVSTVAESKAINHLKGTSIIIAGSGMCTGGRIKHHLVHNIENSENTLLFVGFQAHGTLGREIVDGADRVRIFGAWHSVRAQVTQIHGFSAHADKKELTRWVSGFGSHSKQIYITHGEETTALSFASYLTSDFGFKTSVPQYGEEVSLDAEV